MVQFMESKSDEHCDQRKAFAHQSKMVAAVLTKCELADVHLPGLGLYFDCKLRHEKLQLERTLEQEQEYQVNKLMRKIERLENDTGGKQRKLEELKREKIDLENALEQEQEALVNRLWKRMEKLEAEKRNLQEKLDEPVSAPPSPREIKNGETTETLSRYVEQLRNEVRKLKNQLLSTQMEHQERIVHIQQDEREVREENIRLQRKLLLEQERREALSRHLSESESSLEMDDERQFNEMAQGLRPRTISSPIPYTPNPARPISPAYPALTPPSPATRGASFASSTVSHPSPISPFGTSPPVGPAPLNPHMRMRPQGPSPSGHHDRFVKPTNPTYTSTPTSNS
ncbi:coiled-coil domain-containing protein 6-like [Lytechinus pictus]|uniref:coiled-coil domain-containing protein 6-like n=1 Tax=Lytechinus pictus TaxID=7653 RepID=UPI0030B9C7FE